MEAMHPALRELNINEALEQRLKSDWAREPKAAMKLIISLGTCTLYTSHEDVAAMQLKDKNLEYNSLVVNLDQLSTLGAEAFSQASADARIISARVERIAKKGGLIDRIVYESNRGPEGIPAVRRTFKRLKDDVDKSAQEGQETKKKIDEWKSMIGKLRNSIGQEKKDTIEKHNTAQEISEKNKKEKNDLEGREKGTQERLRQAQIKLKKSRDEHLAALDETDRVVEIETKAATLAAGVFPIIAPLVVGGIYWAYYKNREQRHKIYQQDLDRARGEVDQLMDKLEECTQNLEKARLALESAKTSAEKWEAVKKAAVAVTEQMKNIHGSFSETVQYFTQLNTDIKCISEAYQASYEDAMENPQDENSGLEIWDLPDLALELKCYTLVVYSLLALHADIYDMYTRKGFGLIASFGYPSDDEKGLCSEELEKRREGKMKLFLEEAEKGIDEKIYQGKLRLFNEAKILFPQLTDASELRPRRLGSDGA